MAVWTDEKLERLAQDWMREIADDADGDAGGEVVMMNFTAKPDRQWRFIELAVAAASTDNQFDAIAAGPLEHLLGFHGDAYIERVAAKCAADDKFRQVIKGVWQHRMSDELWAHVRALQGQAN